MSSGSEPSESRRERVPYSRLATDALLADEPCNRIGDSSDPMDSNISLIVKAEEVVSADRSPAGLQKRILGEEALTASLKLG